MPERLLRSRHAHREVEQAQRGRLLRVVLEHVLVAAHARVVIDVARPRHADHGMQQQVGLALARRAEGELLVRAVHGVAGLEGDDLAPAKLAKPPAQLRRRVAQQLEVVVHRRLDAAQLPAHVDRARAMLQEVDARVVIVLRAEDATRLGGLVGLPAVADLHGGDQHAFGIAKRDVIAILEPGRELAAHVEVDRDRPDDARGQPHRREHRLVFGRG